MDDARLEEAIDTLLAALDPSYANQDPAIRAHIKETAWRALSQAIVTEVEDNFSGGGGGGGGAVDDFNGRTGSITPAQADYDTFFLTPAEGNAAYEALGAVAAHAAAVDPHPTYLTAAEGNAAYDAIGAAAAAQAASQPLDPDLTALADIATTGWLKRTGAGTAITATPSASDVGADAAGTAAAAITTHEAASDPHTGYQKESEKGAASGYASLDSGTLVPVAQLPAATTSAKGAVELADDLEATASLAVQGNDNRLFQAQWALLVM